MIEHYVYFCIRSFGIVFNLQMLNASMFSPNLLGRQNDGKKGKRAQQCLAQHFSSFEGYSDVAKG